jgi:hypothetical protein
LTSASSTASSTAAPTSATISTSGTCGGSQAGNMTCAGSQSGGCCGGFDTSAVPRTTAPTTMAARLRARVDVSQRQHTRSASTESAQPASLAT